MAEERHVYHNADGVTREMLFDREQPDQFVVKTSVDMTQVLESIKVDAENHQVRSDNKLVARIPMTIYERSMLEGWDEDDWKKWLNSDEAKPFRVWRGRV